MADSDNSPKKLLLVDDDAAILRMMKLQLELDGYTVVTEDNGPAAIVAVKNTKFLAILLDLHMAGMDGFEVLRQIREAKPRLPVIMVTGSHDEEEARKAFDLGAWDYVTKPIDFNYLKNILLLQSPE